MQRPSAASEVNTAPEAAMDADLQEPTPATQPHARRELNASSLDDLLPNFRPLAEGCDVCALDEGELEWIEMHAIGNLKARVETATILAHEAHNTLLLTLTGTVGALAYAVKLVDGEVTNSAIAASAACIWLMVVSVFIVMRCMRVAPIPAVYLQPESLFERFSKGRSFEEWRARTVLRMERRIQTLITRNAKVAQALNRGRMAALATPVIAGLALATIHYFCRGLQC
jgi:hypothetical protein